MPVRVCECNGLRLLQQGIVLSDFDKICIELPAVIGGAWKVVRTVDTAENVIVDLGRIIQQLD